MTDLAPEKDAIRGEIEDGIAIVAAHPLMSGILSAVGGLVAVLDDDRRILSVNEAFLALTGGDSVSGILGLRPGEAIGCVFAKEAQTRCGEGAACMSCGAAITIVTALRDGHPDERQCVATVEDSASRRDLFLIVRAFPIDANGRRYVILFIRDDTEAQNRAAFERVFHHDLRNIVSGIIGTVSLIEDEHVEEPGGLIAVLSDQIARLDRELELGQILRLDARAQIETHPTFARGGEILSDLESALVGHPAADGKTIMLDSSAATSDVLVDRQILLRVLTNMTVNALEATDLGDEIRVVARDRDDLLDISVWNRAHILEENAKRIFQRNFSTKARAGRGLGTYSMKLFTERHLGGEIRFSSSRAGGTTFTVSIPRGGAALKSQ